MAVLFSDTGVPIKSMNPLPVVIYGPTGAPLFLAEDAAAADGDLGIQALTVRQNTAAALAGSDGDYQPLITDGSGRLHVVETGIGAGNISNAASAATFKDVLPAARYDAALPTLTDGRFNALQADVNGQLYVNSELPAARVAADANTLPTAPDVNAVLFAYDGTNLKLVRAATTDINAHTATGSLAVVPHSFRSTDGAIVGVRDVIAGGGSDSWQTGVPAAGLMLYDPASAAMNRMRPNHAVTALASAARTATTSSADIVNYNGRGIRVRTNITAAPGGDTITVAVEEKDTISGNYVTILTGAAHSTTGQKATLIVYPGVTPAANVAVSEPMPRTFRITVTHSGSGSFTYSVEVGILL